MNETECIRIMYYWLVSDLYRYTFQERMVPILLY